MSENEVHDLLRQALLKDQSEVIPVRRTPRYSVGDRQYRLAIEGGLATFSGVEDILFGERVVYRCLIHRGMIRLDTKTPGSGTGRLDGA